MTRNQRTVNHGRDGDKVETAARRGGRGNRHGCGRGGRGRCRGRARSSSRSGGGAGRLAAAFGRESETVSAARLGVRAKAALGETAPKLAGVLAARQVLLGLEDGITRLDKVL